VDVLDGKKAIGSVVIDAGNVWPEGEWVPTNPIGPKWYEVRSSKRKGEGAVTAEVQLTYHYVGESASALPLCLATRSRTHICLRCSCQPKAS
jgi:hypothetical protein